MIGEQGLNGIFLSFILGGYSYWLSVTMKVCKLLGLHNYNHSCMLEKIVYGYNGHPWDHAKWLLNRDGLRIEVGGTLGLY